jgi:hypothetical protein
MKRAGMTEIIRKFSAQGVLGNLTYRSGGSFVLTSLLFSQQKVQFPLLPLAPEKIDPARPPDRAKAHLGTSWGRCF